MVALSFLLAAGLQAAETPPYALTKQDFFALSASSAAIHDQAGADALKQSDPAAYDLMMKTRQAWWEWVRDTSQAYPEIFKKNAYLCSYEKTIMIQANVWKAAKQLAEIEKKYGREEMIKTNEEIQKHFEKKGQEKKKEGE